MKVMPKNVCQILSINLDILGSTICKNDNFSILNKRATIISEPIENNLGLV